MGSPFSPVGHSNTIKMQYMILLGKLDGSIETPLAWTTSYKIGVSLSEIKWGFYNTSEAGTRESSYLDFTLHDIAGQTISKFLKVKQGGMALYFLGPTSGGYMWLSTQHAIYAPIQENCTIEFSPTQGFTYKFSSMPIGNLSKTKIYSTHSDITINGLDTGNSKHPNTFDDYLKEFAGKWNLKLAENPDKAGTAQIKFSWSGGADNDAAMKQHPVIIDPVKEGKTIKRIGDASTQVAPFKINPGTSVSDAVKSLWNERFKPTEQAASRGIDLGSYLEVNFQKYEGSITIFDVKCHRRTITDNAPATIPVCIGSDKVCSGSPYRAQLAAINFNGIMNLLASTKLSEHKGTGTMEASNAGNTSTSPVTETIKTHYISGKTQMQDTVSVASMSPGWPAGSNLIFDGWAELGSLLNKHKSPQFTIDIDMPYTYAFTPVIHGGLLPDCIPGMVTGAIDYTCGVALLFWWYITPECQTMLPVAEISSTYRITKVIHTIGLAGNSTQVSLSHLNASTTG